MQESSLFCTKVKNSDFLVTGFTYTVYKSALLSEPARVGVVGLVETVIVIINIYFVHLLCV